MREHVNAARERGGETPTPNEAIGEEFRPHVSTQQYGGKARIEGVQLVDLPVFSDEGGDFCEVGRFLNDGTLSTFPGYRGAQLSYSYMEPGTIKAWHLHHRQDDLWFIPPSQRLLVGLLDVREGSPTYRSHMRLAMGAGKARLLFIPRGVAHGVANLTPHGASLLYFVTQHFNADHPDEHRLPHDILGTEFWTIRPG